MHLASLSFLLDPRVLIATLGVIGVIAIIFLETGFLFGFFLPGDSLLFTAGLLASQGYISLGWLLVGTWIAAILGDSLGYAIGKKAGPALFVKEDSFFFNKKHIARAQHFFETYGKKTIFLARFIPVVRTCAPVVAGIGGMRYRTFLSYNIFGGFVWTWLMLLIGYGFGTAIPDPDKYILPIIAVIILLSVIPPLWQMMKARRL